jgi:hypothetical protein
LTEDGMDDIDDALRSDDPPVGPSPHLATSVMEAVRLEKSAPPPPRTTRMAWATGGLSVLILLAVLALGILSEGMRGPGETLLEAGSGHMARWLEWGWTSGSQMLWAAIGLVAIVLLVRRAERTL